MRTRRSRAQSVWLLVLGVSLLTLVAVPLVAWWAYAGAATSVASVGSRSPGPSGPAVQPSPRDEPAGDVTPEAVDPPVAVPMRVRIPRLDINSVVLPVGLDEAKAGARSTTWACWTWATG